MEFLKDYLKSIGTPASVMAEIEAAMADPEKAKTFDVKKNELVFNAAKKSLIEADPDLFKDKINEAVKNADGKMLGQLERYLKRDFNLTTEEIKELSLEEKIKFAAEKNRELYSKTAKELQDENINLKLKVKEFEEVIVPSTENKGKEEVKNYKKREKLLAEIRAEEGIFPAEIAILGVLEKWGNINYDLDERDQPTVLTKDTNLPIRNADGTAILGFKEKLKETLSEISYLKQSNGGDPKPEPKTIVKNDEVFSSSLSEAEKNLLEIKNSAKK